MKILLVHNSYQRSGGEDVVFDQEYQLLKSAGHQVLEYHRSNSEIADYSAVQRLGLVKQTVWATDTRRDITRMLGQEKPQLVHVHNTFLMISPSIYSACQDAQVPVVQTLHNYRLFCPAADFFRDGKPCEECIHHSLWRGVRYGCYRGSRPATAAVALMLFVHRSRGTWMVSVDFYVVPTEFARRKFIESGLPGPKLTVKPNFVHPDPGERTADGSYALFAGRLSHEKGLHTLLAAWELLHDSVPLHIVGDGPLRSELQTEARRGGLSSVHFQGRLTRHETITAMKGARFVIFPSECYESFGMAIAEAYACGVPVIASGLGAAQEMVEDGRTGIVFRPGDAGDLAEKVAWAWSHPHCMQQRGKEARAEYESKYTAAKSYSILLDLYQRAIATRTQPA